MKRPLKIFLTLTILIAAILVWAFLKPGKSGSENLAQRVLNKIDVNSDTIDKTIQPGPGIVELNVPFTSQSPLAHWSDPEEEAGCEEASMVMAEHWLQGDQSPALDTNAAVSEIHAIIDFENKNYGNSIDTSAADTTKTFNAYYSTDKMTVMNDVSIDAIINQLDHGNLVIIPTNGKALKNPHFQSPGPDTHMLVIRGYDSNKKEFITNDPGTKFGANYRYGYDLLYSAIRDYPTGNHLPITGDAKTMLVVSK